MNYDSMTILIIYVLFINVFGYYIIAADKKKAQAGQWRISEKRIFQIALIGGSIGVYIGMKEYRHKTKHASFMIGIPVIIVFQILLLICVLFFI